MDAWHGCRVTAPEITPGAFASPESFVHDPQAASWFNELTRPDFLADFYEED